MEVSGQLRSPAALPSGKEPPVSIGKEAGWAPEPVWMWCRREKFPGIESRSSDRPSRSQSLYRLSYLGSFTVGVYTIYLYTSRKSVTWAEGTVQHNIHSGLGLPMKKIKMCLNGTYSKVRIYFTTLQELFNFLSCKYLPIRF
jgi:hypothetical protein